MELNQADALTLPLFKLDDIQTFTPQSLPYGELSVILDEDILAHLCQNPDSQSSVSVEIPNYQITFTDSSQQSDDHQAYFVIHHGPLLTAELHLSDGQLLISPQVDMMPTFDLE